VFKNLKLSMKMAGGFGVLVVIAAVLGLTGWWGLSGVSQNVGFYDQGNVCLEKINKCGYLRRDFTIRGFEKFGGEGKDASEQWLSVYDELAKDLQLLTVEEGLSTEGRELAKAGLASGEQYKQAFGLQISSRKAKDDAFAEWGKVGWDVTKIIEETTQQVIAPKRDAAEQSKDAEAIIQWSKIASGLDEQFIQPFLLLRVCAVYLLATDADKQWEAYGQQLTKVGEGLAQWGRTVKGDAELEQVATRLGQCVEQYQASGKKYWNGVLDQRRADQEMVTSATSVMDSIGGLQTTLKASMDSITAWANTAMTLLTIGGIVVGVVMAFLITRSIVKPINRVIAGLTSGAEQVAAASGQVSQSSQQMAEGASEQASSLEETSSSLEELTSMTKQNAENARQASSMSTEVGESAGRGGDAMTRMSEAINKIKTSSDQTAKILKTIDEIAFQTNLLALNAAVEAARAGEAGKGFAVVAEEVRNLAQRSAEAAKNTASLIEDAQKNAENGVSVSEEVASMLKEIIEGVGNVTRLVGEVSSASDQQAQGIDQINTAVAQMDKVTQSNAANAEESASASEELSAQAVELTEMVGALVQIVEGSKAQRGTGQGKALRPAAEARKTVSPRRSVASPKATSGVGEDHHTDPGMGDF